MTQIFLNDDLRKQLIDNGLNRASLFSWDKTAEKVWEVIATEIQQLS